MDSSFFFLLRFAARVGPVLEESIIHDDDAAIYEVAAIEQDPSLERYVLVQPRNSMFHLSFHSL